MFPVGFAITLGGVAILTLRSRKTTDHMHLDEVVVAASNAAGLVTPPLGHPVGGQSEPVLARQASRASLHSAAVLHASSRAPPGTALSWPAQSQSQAAVNAAAVPSAGAMPKRSDPTASPSSVVPHFHTDDTVSPISEEQNQV